MERAELLERFAAFPARLRPAALAAAGRHGSPTDPGEWGPAEVVRHLIAVELEVHQARLADVAGDGHPTWSWAEPGPWPGDPGASPETLVARFTELRAATVATVRGLDDAGWARHGTHATFGQLDVGGLLRVADSHDAEHLAGLVAD